MVKKARLTPPSPPPTDGNTASPDGNVDAAGFGSDTSPLTLTESGDNDELSRVGPNY
jgi:hypothetical protein